jgi:hypothetical protein
MKTKFDEFITEKKSDNIRLGNSYTTKYLSPNNFLSTEIKTTEGFVKSYIITNKENAPLFKGILNIMDDGRAIFHAKYITYSDVKNNYKVYFDKQGKEIIHSNNSTKEEKKYFDSL